MLKRLLQNLVVKTNFCPFNRLYKFYYNAALKIIVYILKKQKEIVAIYLTAGMATGNYVCGLSDIDLINVLGKWQKRRYNYIQYLHRKVLGYLIRGFPLYMAGIFLIIF